MGILLEIDNPGGLCGVSPVIGISGRERHMKSPSRLMAVFGFIFLLGCAIPALGQVSVSVAQLNGTVQDSNGAVVPKATITLREVDKNRVYTATSNDAGYYVVPNLPPGNYELTATYTGFAKYSQSGIVLTVGQTATVNVTLSAAGIEQSVVVSSETPLEPSRTEVSQVIAPSQIA